MKQHTQSRLGRKSLLVVLMLLMSFTVGNVYATNGYFSHGYGTPYKGMAGAGVALHLHGLGIATNPAAIAYLSSRVDVGFALFNPNREYTVTGNPSGFPGTFGLAPGTFESDSKMFVVPYATINFAVAGGNALGFSIYGNGGMNTNYPTNTFMGTEPTGVDLSQMFFAFSYAREIIPNHAIGVTGIVSYQFFEARGLEAFGQFGVSGDPAHLSNNGHDNASGFGVRVGYMGDLTPFLSIGASYQSKIAMDEFTDYAGLFADHGDFDIPASWTAGVAVKPTPKLTIAADVQTIMYSDVNSVANPMDPMKLFPAFPDPNDPTGQTFMPNPAFVPLGAEGAAGFGWEDMTAYKFGLQYELNDNLTLRGGYSFGDQPIPESEVLFNILAPGVMEQHVTLGFTARLNEKLQLNGAFMHAFSNTVTGPNPLEPVSPQEIELKMNQLEGELGLSISL